MNKIAVLLLVSLALTSLGQEKIQVVSHDRVTITTDPSKGVNNYPGWAVFPGSGFSARKIIMYVTLGCPDSIPCAHWDYLDHITVSKTGGKQGKVLNYEIGRMLTPYGSIYTKGWDFTWKVDVTDFSMILRDSVEINYAHSGYEPATVGWALSVCFEVFPGPQVIKPTAIVPMWSGSFPYGDPTQPISEKLIPLSFSTDKNSPLVRFRIQQTGHGMDEPKGCSEFCNRWREVILDEDTVDRKELWKDCGANPLYPQGGTWIYDRALWCPGDLQQPDIYDFLPGQGNHNLGLNMEPYTATGNINAREDIASFLIYYKTPSRANDVSIEEIIVPNDDKLYGRFNPACFNPRIIVRNLGRNHLKSLDIAWHTEGFQMKKYHWEGDLPFNKTKEIILPGEIDMAGGKNKFSISLSNPNGKRDAWERDNSLIREFDPPTELPEKIIVRFLTNNRPEENSLFIVNSSKDTVYMLKAEVLKPKTIYSDTLELSKGNYEFTLTDSGGDGLEFWYEVEQGYGYLRFFDLEGRLLKNFESDCGNGQFLAFSTRPDFMPDTLDPEFSFILFPRRATNEISLDYMAEKDVPMEVLITSDGVVVESHWYNRVNQGKFTYDISHLPSGRYIMEVLMDGQSRFKRRFNKE